MFVCPSNMLNFMNVVIFVYLYNFRSICEVSTNAEWEANKKEENVN